MGATLIRLRYPATCRSCGAALPKGTEAQWNRQERQATCIACLGPADPDRLEFDRGEAGGSAAREWTRRHEKRETEIRSRYGKLGGVVLALSKDPHSTNAWAHGANGERALGKLLGPFFAEGMGVLHDRRIPVAREHRPHLVITPSGVFVIDAKNYKGRVERRDRGWFSTDQRLYVGGRDRTTLVGGMRKQAEAVRQALAVSPEEIPIIQTLCFVAADWSLFARPIQFDGVQVLWPRALGKQLRADGRLGSARIGEIERRLAIALPAA